MGGPDPPIQRRAQRGHQKDGWPARRL